MEIHYNFLIVTHECNINNKCNKICNKDILLTFGHELQKKEILNRFQVAQVHYPSEVPVILESYPYLHYMVKEFPSIFFFTKEGWNNFTSGKDLSLNDVKLYSGMLCGRYYPIMKKENKILTLIPITEKMNESRKLNLEDIFKWVSDIKRIDSK